MNATELEQSIEELEIRLERLRSLYEQYFLGIERIEPAIARKDVDRRIYVLRREKIRNTGKRFKLQTIIQRYNTFQQYWQRVCREIENGTYKRHVQRAQRLQPEELLTIAARKRLGKRRLSSIPPATEEALLAQESARVSLAPQQAASVATAQASPSVPARPSSTHPPALGPITAKPVPPRPSTSQPPRAPVGKPLAPAQPAAAKADVDSLDFDLGFLGDWDPNEAKKSKPGVAPSAPTAEAKPPGARMAPPPKPARVAPQPAPLPSVPQPAPAPIAKPLASANLTSAKPAIAPPPKAGADISAKPAAAAPAMPVLVASATAAGSSAKLALSPTAKPRPAATAAPSVVTPAAATPKAAAPIAKPAEVSQAAGPVAKPAAPIVKPAAPIQNPPAASVDKPQSAAIKPAAAAKPAASLAVAPAPKAQPAEVKPAAAPAQKPAASANLSDERVRELHARLSEAKRTTKDNTAVSFEGLSKSLKATEEKLRAQHKNRRIDFDIVIKDGKAVVKPIVR